MGVSCQLRRDSRFYEQKTPLRGVLWDSVRWFNVVLSQSSQLRYLWRIKQIDLNIIIIRLTEYIETGYNYNLSPWKGMIMETEGILYKTIHCEDCGMLFLVKPGSLNRYCDTCGEKKVLQIKKLLSTLHEVNPSKGLLAKN